MQVNHIALYVNDLEAMKDFYIKYFGASANSKYHNVKTGLQTYFLSFEDGTRIEIMNKPNVTQKEGTLERCGYIHVAFSVGNQEKVDELTETLKDDGYQVISGPRTTGDGYYESCILDPEQNMIEIVA
ncbi:VOC family protein [Anaerosacchariphilus polymeriproducens]|uniref:Glyoxalase n=1 Tax=Anaerosacchariphilus polymeriproducens TaxID=1812858 RepID=A0A371ASY0_9FIRM|nr:VOC family protein [Anaerosacchariphilus polymeriproducens]RDU22642.1 glyoxalase [Anaerosacchariphilus polymeriproducens]